MVLGAGPRLADGEGPNMLLDDGGDVTLLVHKGVEYEKAGAVPDPRRRRAEEHEGRSVHAPALARAADANRYTPHRPATIKGVTEETTTGVHRLYEIAEDRRPAVPGHQRQRLGDEVEVRQPLRLPPLADRRHQPRDRRDDRRQGRASSAATATSARAARESLRGQGARVLVTEIDPICALQAAMEGYEVVTLDDVVDTGGHLRHDDRQQGHHHVAKRHGRMKHQAIVGNIGHFDNEIDIAGLARTPRASSAITIKPQVDEWRSRTALDHRAVARAGC